MDSIETSAGDQRHMTPQDLALRLGVPLSSIYGWRSQHKGPRAMRIGKHVRYRIVDVLTWEQLQLDKDVA
ncbi:hypothetical protein GCM10023063_28490 [Arthrobacter methylotrophus]|uniref:Helix-turn-helix domain-containing protein n=1 Tax=Arthrobacter methylotrophus TaxID=121291 RepID=A0ABV5UQJ0_9MICC